MSFATPATSRRFYVRQPHGRNVVLNRAVTEPGAGRTGSGSSVGGTGGTGGGGG
ncbi:unnamed protein product, partial [Protopolystoma xenopodis]